MMVLYGGGIYVWVNEEDELEEDKKICEFLSLFFFSKIDELFFNLFWELK